MTLDLLLYLLRLAGVLLLWLAIVLGLWAVFMRGRRRQHIIESRNGGYELADDPDMQLAPRRWRDDER